MKKAKFNYYGHLSLGGQIALLIVFCVVLVFGILFWKSMEKQETLSFLLIIISLGTITYWVVNNIVTHLKQLECRDGKLIITPLLTKKVQEITLKELAGYQFNELTLKTQLMDRQGKTVATMYTPFYKELNAFFLENSMKQMDQEERYFRRLAS